VISAEYAISRTRRGLALGAVLRWALIVLIGGAFLVQPMLDSTGISAVMVVVIAAGAWLFLSFRSVRGSRMAADSTSLIAAGQYELAEQNIAESLETFSIFRTVKLMSLHHLALLRHAQNRWQDSAVLSRALLTQRLASASGLDRSSRLILAESLLELGDLRGAYENLRRLYDQRLSLREALSLLAVQTDYLSRIGAWEPMLDQLPGKIETAELMSATQSARTQALLALAARKTDRNAWSDWLRRRVELLVDVQKLCTDRPLLWDLWKK
jgi:hypothetical protein